MSAVVAAIGLLAAVIPPVIDEVKKRRADSESDSEPPSATDTGSISSSATVTAIGYAIPAGLGLASYVVVSKVLK